MIMISKLYRSSYSSFKFINNPLSLKAINNITFNKDSCIITSKRCFHSNDDKIDQFSSSSNISEDIYSFDKFAIPDLPILDQSGLLNGVSEPSFASLGLCNYTPAGLVQFILENVHMYCSLPWWACIGITAVLLRTCMIPLMVDQRRTLMNYQTNMAKMTNTMIEAVSAKEAGNSMMMLSKLKEFEEIINKSQISIISLMKPFLIQGPVFISVFIALRGMAEAPVNSLKVGGLYWFTDLTVYDPYYIIPLVNALTLALVLETGAEAPTPQGKNLQMAMRFVPFIIFVVTCHFPSTLLLYWSFSNTFSLAFAMLMKFPSFKKSLNWPDFVAPKEVPNPNNYGLKDIMTVMKSMQEVTLRSREEEQRWSKEEQQTIMKAGIEALDERKKAKQKLISEESSDKM